MASGGNSQVAETFSSVCSIQGRAASLSRRWDSSSLWARLPPPRARRNAAGRPAWPSTGTKRLTDAFLKSHRPARRTRRRKRFGGAVPEEWLESGAAVASGPSVQLGLCVASPSAVLMLNEQKAGREAVVGLNKPLFLPPCHSKMMTLNCVPRAVHPKSLHSASFFVFFPPHIAA